MLPTCDPGDIGAAIEYFQANGYVIFRNVVPPPIATAFWADVEANVAHNPLVQFSLYGRIYLQRDLPDDLRTAVPRIIDIQGHVPLAVHLMFVDPIPEFLRALHGAPPTWLQTLTCKFSSEQGAHSDYYLVSPPCVGDYNRGTLTAAWMPFEASSDRNGALVVYPGSHRLQKKRLDTDFDNEYGRYVDYLRDLCERSGSQPTTDDAEPGDLLFWHGDLVHAGGPIRQQSPRPTRRSLVCHHATVPDSRPSMSPDWVRLRTLRGSYHIPAASRIASSGGSSDAGHVTGA
jgi:ectoine hydroxylase-related dioxygenase (phytanoyl-CoA dioxygenase family)